MLKDLRHAPVPIRHFIQKNILVSETTEHKLGSKRGNFAVFNLIQFTVNCLPQTVVIHVCVLHFLIAHRSRPHLHSLTLQHAGNYSTLAVSLC